MNLDDISFRGRGLIWRLLYNPEVMRDQSCPPVLVIHVQTHLIKPSRQRRSFSTDRKRDDVVEQLLSALTEDTQFPNPQPQAPHLASDSPSPTTIEETPYLDPRESDPICCCSVNQQIPPHLIPVPARR
jgi:hypothetical protein